MQYSRNRELNALLTLLDDYDREVIDTVEARLLSFGQSIIPELENYWEQAVDDQVQDRIEMIIHRIHFGSLQQELRLWAHGESDLLYGAMLVAKYQYPEQQTLQTFQDLERIRRNIWLEMNSYLTPLEQIRIMESILYNYYKMRGGEVVYHQPNEYIFHKVLESKKGNAITNGILYLVLAEQLDLPIRAINIPRQFVLAWFSQQALFDNQFEAGPTDLIKYYIDPNSGTGFQKKDIDLYFKRINVQSSDDYFKPMNNRQIIRLLLEQFSMCFDNEAQRYKRDDIRQLIQIINEAEAL